MNAANDKNYGTCFYDGNFYQIWDIWQAAKYMPREVIELATISDQIEDTVWGRTVLQTIQANELIEHEGVKKHVRRVFSADLSYPIILAPDGYILDGFHRLIKYILRKRRHIPVIRLKSLPEPCEPPPFK